MFSKYFYKLPSHYPITWNGFVGLWGGINFIFPRLLFFSFFLVLKLFPFALASIAHSGKKQSWRMLFQWWCCSAAYLIWGSFFVCIIRDASLFCRTTNLELGFSVFEEHNAAFFMCYLHTIYSDFSQFKINYVSLSNGNVTIKQFLFVIYKEAIKVWISKS